MKDLEPWSAHWIISEYLEIQTGCKIILYFLNERKMANDKDCNFGLLEPPPKMKTTALLSV